MLRDHKLVVTFKGPDGQKHSFDVISNVPENAKDYKELFPEAPGDDWNKLAQKQYTTNVMNENRRKAIDEVTGKAVGVREFAKFLRDAGITPEEAMDLLRQKAGK